MKCDHVSCLIGADEKVSFYKTLNPKLFLMVSEFWLNMLILSYPLKYFGIKLINGNLFTFHLDEILDIPLTCKHLDLFTFPTMPFGNL